MKIIERIEDYQNPGQPIVLTIGNFDGVHRGHQMILKRLKEKANRVEGQQLLITFKNHPSEILKPGHSIPLLCTLEHKLYLIEKAGVDTTLLLTFTRSLANHSAADFIKQIRRVIPFEYLLLGYDATFGKDRQGKQHIIQSLASDWGFNVEYLDEYRYEGKPVSSSRIRTLLQSGELEEVQNLLGRPYSIYIKVPNIDRSKFIQLDLKGLCLPPSGYYQMIVRYQNASLEGEAFLESSFLSLKINSQDTIPQNSLVEIILKHH